VTVLPIEREQLPIQIRPSIAKQVPVDAALARTFEVDLRDEKRFGLLIGLRNLLAERIRDE